MLAAVRSIVCVAGVALFCAPAPAQPEKAAGAKATEKAPARSDEGKPFSVEGNYVEACSCEPPCACEMMRVDTGCKGVGFASYDKATYGGEDFSGTRFAYALGVGDWVNVYIDQPDARKHAAAEKFARAHYKIFGAIKQVKDAKIEISGKDGAYTATVDGGKVMKCQTEPILGGDGKTAIRHENTKDPVNTTMLQGSCVSCSYSDGDRKFDLAKGRNAYFNPKVKASGKM